MKGGELFRDVLMFRNGRGRNSLSTACYEGHTETVNAILDYLVRSLLSHTGVHVSPAIHLTYSKWDH